MRLVELTTQRVGRALDLLDELRVGRDMDELARRVYADIRWSPRVILTAFAFLGVFLWELVLANLNVARLVFSPRIRIRPGIVEIKTRLTSPMGRLALANAITLTPGTLVVDVRDDSLFIHWIVVSSEDPEAATRAIAGRFERYLEVIYG